MRPGRPGTRELVAQRQAQAMKLRVAGASFRAIAEALAVSGGRSDVAALLDS